MYKTLKKYQDYYDKDYSCMRHWLAVALAVVGNLISVYFLKDLMIEYHQGVYIQNEFSMVATMAVVAGITLIYNLLIGAFFADMSGNTRFYWYKIAYLISPGGLVLDLIIDLIIFLRVNSDCIKKDVEKITNNFSNYTDYKSRSWKRETGGRWMWR